MVSSFYWPGSNQVWVWLLKKNKDFHEVIMTSFSLFKILFLFFSQKPNGTSPVLLPSPRGPRGGNLHCLCPQVRLLRPTEHLSKCFLFDLFFVCCEQFQLLLSRKSQLQPLSSLLLVAEVVSPGCKSFTVFQGKSHFKRGQ